MVAILSLLVALGACGSSKSPAAAAPAASADSDFIQHMLVHHERALQLGQLAAARGADPRVRAFGQRILAEQTPERERLSGWVQTLDLHPNPAADRMAASGYVSDAEYQALMQDSPRLFDRSVLLLSASSEAGAVSMAQAELTGGRYAPARALATSIATAKTGEIPELQNLVAQLPR